MNIYDVTRNGVWVRQIVANNQREAEMWVSMYLPTCSVRFSYRLAA